MAVPAITGLCQDCKKKRTNLWVKEITLIGSEVKNARA
jgi:hypothetical protein